MKANVQKTHFGGAMAAMIIALVSAAIPAVPAGADTIDLSYKYVEAGAVLDVYLGSTRYYHGNQGADGVARVDTRNPSGALAAQLATGIWAACYEVDQSTNFAPQTYTIQSLDSVFSPGQASLIRQLWANCHDADAETGTPIFYGGSNGGFTSGEPANTAENINSIAFIYAIYEIRHDYDGSMGSLDPTDGNFKLGPDQSPLGLPTTGLQSILDATQTMLDGLVDPQAYTGHIPDLLALTNLSWQDFIVEVPEPATLALLALGGAALLRRRGNRSRWISAGRYATIRK